MIKEQVFGISNYFTGCHAATLATDSDGNILAAWFAGSHEGHDDVAIWLCKRDENGWGIPKMIAKVNETPHWNPVLFNPGNGRIYLFFKVGKPIPEWYSWLTVSDDDGNSWSEPRELVVDDRSGGRGPVKNKPIVLSDGSWLAPASVETSDTWQAFTDLSVDEGESWQRSNLIHFADQTCEGKGVIQPTLWESKPGHVHMLMRSTCGRICRSDSDDYGRTWCQAHVTDLPNNNSGIDLTKLDNGNLLLIYNPTSDRRKRTPLRLSLSTDNGNTWHDLMDIETDDVTVGHLIQQDGGEFSYPSVISSGTTVSAIYTRHRRQITFWQARVEDILDQRVASKETVCV